MKTHKLLDIAFGFSFHLFSLMNPFPALHPSYKIQWMQEQGWEVQYVAQAKQLLEKVYEDQYGATQHIVSAHAGTTMDVQEGYELDFFGDDIDLAMELDCYLGEARRSKRQDILGSWRSWGDLPGLQQMARDYLCIPATSAESEQVFSAGRDLIVDKRAWLGPVMIRHLSLLKNWKHTFPKMTCRDL